MPFLVCSRCCVLTGLGERCKTKRKIPSQKAVFTPSQRTIRLGFPKEFRAVRHLNPTEISSEKSQL